MDVLRMDNKEDPDIEEDDSASFFGRKVPFLSSYFGLLGLIFMIGPICGIIGARSLKRQLVTVYLCFCIAKVLFDFFAAFFTTVFFWYIIFVLIQLWVIKIVLTFWRALGNIP